MDRVEDAAALTVQIKHSSIHEQLWVLEVDKSELLLAKGTLSTNSKPKGKECFTFIPVQMNNLSHVLNTWTEVGQKKSVETSKPF